MVFCVSCGKFDIKLLIPILGGIIRIISNYILLDIYPKFFSHPIIYYILPSLSRCFGLLFYLREPNVNELCDSENIKHFTIIKYQKYILIALSSLFEFLETVLSYFETINVDIENSLDIIFVNLFSLFILKTKFYKHQYIVIIICIILSILVTLLESDELEGTFDEFIKILLLIISHIFSNLKFVIDKYTMENKSASIFEIFFYNGLITLFLYIIYLIIFTNYEITEENEFFKDISFLVDYKEKKYFDNFFSYYESIDAKEFIYIAIFVIFEFLIRLSFLFTIKYFSPNHLFLLFSITKISNLFNGQEFKWKSYITIIIYTLIVFLNLVFIEVIELNFCGLSENTKKNINKRAQLESLKSEINLYKEDDDEEIISNPNNNKELESRLIDKSNMQTVN